MKKLLLILALALCPSAAFAQCSGIFPPNTFCGNNIPFNVGNIVTGLANGTQIWFDLSASAGAGTFTVANITCTAFEF